jgi:hypothetical protein
MGRKILQVVSKNIYYVLYKIKIFIYSLGIKRHISCLESKFIFDINKVEENDNVIRVIEKLSTSVRLSECNLINNSKKNLLEFNSTVS